MYAPFNREFDLPPPINFQINNLDLWNFAFSEMLFNQGLWDRQPIPAQILYTTRGVMAPYNTCVENQWYVFEDGNPNSPVLVIDFVPDPAICPITSTPKLVIATGDVSKAAAHEGVMQAIAFLHPEWQRLDIGPDPDGHPRTRWILPATIPIRNSLATYPATALSGLFKKLPTFPADEGPSNGGYLLTHQLAPNNTGRVTLYSQVDTISVGVHHALGLLSDFQTPGHPIDADPTKIITRRMPAALRALGFVNQYQLVMHTVISDPADTEQYWLYMSAPKLPDIRRTIIEPDVVTEAVIAVHTGTVSAPGASFRSSPICSGSSYQRVNGTTKLQIGAGGDLLSFPHVPLFGGARHFGRATRWSSGRGVTPIDASGSRGEIYDPWAGMHFVNSNQRGAIFCQPWDCIWISDGTLVDGQTFLFDGRMFKVYNRFFAGRVPVAVVFRVGEESEALPPPIISPSDISAFLVDLDGAGTYGLAAYGTEYGRYGENSVRGIPFPIYEANLVKPFGLQSAVMAFPIRPVTVGPPPGVARFQAYVGRRHVFA